MRGLLRSCGFSLIEMMLSMLIGTIILAGIFTIFSNSREAQRTLDQHLTMVGDARFAIELLTHDLRQASIYGGTNLAALITCRTEDACATPATVPTNDCDVGWAYDLDLPVYSPVTNAEVAGYEANCPINSHVNNTDVVVVRYADTSKIAEASLLADTAYIRSNFLSGIVFVGSTQPTFSGDTGDALTNNYQLISRAYYISDFTDTAGDGIPSLRRLELSTGSSGEPILVDQVLMPGVQDLQIQFGIDTNNDGDINQYVNAANVSANSVTDATQATRISAKTDWSKVKAVKIWVLVRGEKKEPDGFNTSSATSLSSG